MKKMMNIRLRGPGPAAYLLPRTFGFINQDIRKQRLPQYSFGKHHRIINKSFSPGPAAYYVQKVTRYGSDGTPKYTMGPQTFKKEKSQGPGPGAHENHLKPFWKGTTAPAFSLQSRHYIAQNKIVSPPPNAYNVQLRMVKPSLPSYSIGLVWNTIEKSRSPGPATYGSLNLNMKMNKSPAYSMTGRNLYAFNKCTPGPNVYDRSYYRPGKSAVAYSFGTRHSEYAPPMVVPCDNIL